MFNAVDNVTGSLLSAPSVSLFTVNVCLLPFYKCRCRCLRLFPFFGFSLAIRLSTINFVTYSCCIELDGALNVEGVTAVAHNRLVQKRSREGGWADHFAQNQKEKYYCNAATLSLWEHCNLVAMFQALAVQTSHLAQPSTAWVSDVLSKRFSEVMLTG